jgi:hypothetical protein
MKFLTLVKKEFRESLPWMCLAFIVVAGLGALVLHDELYSDEARRKGGLAMSQYSPWCPSPIDGLGPLVLLTALGLGLVMGVRQFYVPAFDRTWAFTLHRPVNQSTIVHAKLTVATLGLALFVGLPWTMLYLYAAVPGRFMDPVLPGILGEGWLLIALGFILYLGTAVSSLQRARWYATRGFGLAFALTLVVVSSSAAPFPAPFVFIGIGLAILGVQVYALMRSREF